MKSLKGLARKLCVPLEELEKLAANMEAQYRTFPQTRHGKTRTITEPSERLKSVQRRIYEELLKPVPIPDHLHGSVPRRSALTNAQAHATQPWLARIDIASFFPSVTPHHVYALWTKQLHCSPAVASLLTRLTTFKFQLPQGTPTSPALANLILASVDQAILHLASESRAKFTRYVDDLGLSGEKPQDLIPHVATLLQRQGFKVSRKKVSLMPRNRQQEITGYGTNSHRPSLAKKHRARIRAAIHQLSYLDPGSRDYQKQLQSIQGRIGHLSRTNPGPARRLEQHLRTKTRTADL